MVSIRVVFGPIIRIVGFPGAPVNLNCCWHSLSLSQWKHMSIDLVHLGWTFPSMTCSAMMLSVWMDVGGCLQPSSLRMMQM